MIFADSTDLPFNATIRTKCRLDQHFSPYVFFSFLTVIDLSSYASYSTKSLSNNKHNIVQLGFGSVPCAQGYVKILWLD